MLDLFLKLLGAKVEEITREEAVRYLIERKIEFRYIPQIVELDKVDLSKEKFDETDRLISAQYFN